MPKMTDRERLAKIETDQRSLAEEAEKVRREVRARYGKMAAELPVEKLSEREFRDLLSQAIRVGGGAAVATLKGMTANGGVPENSTGQKPVDRRKRGSVLASEARPGGDGAEKTVQP